VAFVKPFYVFTRDLSCIVVLKTATNLQDYRGDLESSCSEDCSVCYRMRESSFDSAFPPDATPQLPTLQPQKDFKERVMVSTERESILEMWTYRVNSQEHSSYYTFMEHIVIDKRNNNQIISQDKKKPCASTWGDDFDEDSIEH
jgi:hypothetical protein